MLPLQPTRRGFTFVELVIVITVIAALAGIGFPVYKSVRKQVDINATKALISAVVTAMSTYQLKTWTWNTAAVGATPELKTYHIWDLNHQKGPDIPTQNDKNLRFYSIDGYTPGSRVEHPQSYRDAVRDGTNLDVQMPIESEWSNEPWNMDKTKTYDANFPKEVLASGYTGFINMVAPSIHKSFINKRGILIDAWKQPLRIEFGAKKFGTDPMGIWSPGFDKWDATFMDAARKDYDVNADDLRSWE